MDAAIESRDVRLTKNKNHILNGLTCVVKPGSITGLIGPSGSGKTTLMRCIVGVQAFTGKLEVLGMPAGGKLLRSRIGYVSQGSAVYPDLTVTENLRYFGTLQGGNKANVDEIIATVQLQDQAKQVVSSLSGGQAARVNLAIALLGDPELLILDEPTVGLDPLLRNDLWDFFTELAKKGKTLLISSHVMDEAERCENLLLMRHGKFLWTDTKDALLKNTGKSSVHDAFIAKIEEGEQNVSR